MEKEGDKMSNYGMKTTVTAVLNDDKYDIGVTYSDSNGRSLDKRLNGNIDNLENDISLAILEGCLALMKQDKKASVTTPKEHITITEQPSNAATVDSVKDRFAELEEENRRLNDKINSILNGTSTISKPAVEEKKVQKPETAKTHTATMKLYDDEIERVLRLLGF